MDSIVQCAFNPGQHLEGLFSAQSKDNTNFRFDLKLQMKEETQLHFGFSDPALREWGNSLERQGYLFPGAQSTWSQHSTPTLTAATKSTPTSCWSKWQSASGAIRKSSPNQTMRYNYDPFQNASSASLSNPTLPPADVTSSSWRQHLLWLCFFFWCSE